MGWIHDRHMRSGGSLNRNPHRQRKGPLRRIVATIRASSSIFDAAYVELECGHKTFSYGAERARCVQCVQPPASDPSDG